MAQAGSVGKEEQPSPARGQVWDISSSSTQQPDHVHDADHYCGRENKTQERMGETPMMRKAKDRPFETGEYVQIRGLSRESHGGSGEGGFAVKSSSRQTRAGKEMGDRFQIEFLT